MSKCAKCAAGNGRNVAFFEQEFRQLDIVVNAQSSLFDIAELRAIEQDVECALWCEARYAFDLGDFFADDVFSPFECEAHILDNAVVELEGCDGTVLRKRRRIRCRMALDRRHGFDSVFVRNGEPKSPSRHSKLLRKSTRRNDAIVEIGGNLRQFDVFKPIVN